MQRAFEGTKVLGLIEGLEFRKQLEGLVVRCAKIDLAGRAALFLVAQPLEGGFFVLQVDFFDQAQRFEDVGDVVESADLE